MSDAIRGQCRLCGKPEESHHWHPLAHGGIVRNGRPGYLHCPTNSCDVCTECGENREKHRCPNGATFYTAHSVAQPAPIAGEEELVFALCKALYTEIPMGPRLAATLPIIRSYVGERVAEAEQQSKKFTYCAYCGHTESVDVDGEIIAQHIRTCVKHPLNIELANLKAQQAERVKEAERQAQVIEAKVWQRATEMIAHGNDIRTWAKARIAELEAKP